ncbi:MAG: DUF2156 domain-containing protein [Cetobacterium sp.]
MNWKKLTLESKSSIDEFLKNSFETSDLNFTNFYLWSFSENIEYSINDNILNIRGYYLGVEYYFAPICKEFNEEDIVLNIKKIKDLNGKFVFIPEQYNYFLKNKFNLEEERDSFDYIYLQEDLAFLKGRKFSSKKNKINKFFKTYVFQYEKISNSNIEEVRDFQRKWSENRKHDEIILSETMGIEELLNNYEKLNLRGGILKVDDKVIGYAIGEKITQNMGVIHIEKADSEYSGSYQMINMLLAKEEFTDVEFINREDDFGSLGLREAKLSYQPIKLIKKYSI